MDGGRVKRILCWLFGHRWVPVLVDCNRAVTLMHLSTQAGTLSLCMRCGEYVDDLGGEARAHFKERGVLP